MPDVLACKRDAEPADFSQLGEEELVLLAKGGSSRAVEWIVERYKGFVKLRSGSYFLAGADREDIIQEGMIGLYKAILSFQPGRGAAFKTFAELCISRQILSAVKTATRQKHMPLNTYVSFDREAGGMDCFEHMGYAAEKNESNPEQIIIERESIIGMRGRIDKALSRFEAEVLMHHLNGMPYGEIAAAMGREPKSIDNALQRIKRKLEKFLLV